MAGATVNDGTGTTVVFGTSAFTAQVTNIDISDIAREAIDTTHMGTAAPGAGKFANMTFIPSDLSDPGSFDMEIHFNPDTEPPIDQPAETITITFPLVAGDTTSPIWAATGFATNMGAVVPLGDKMTATLTVKLSGNITLTAAT